VPPPPRRSNPRSDESIPWPYPPAPMMYA